VGGNAKVKKAVIPAAGLGTRMLPATKSIPKELLPLVDKPLIHYIVEEIIEAGIKEVIFVISKGKEAILDYFDIDKELESFLTERNKQDILKSIKSLSRMINLISIRQKEPLGLGHAVLTAKDIIGNEPFAVVLPDDIVDAKKGCLSQLMDVYNRRNSPVIALERIPKKETIKYGVVDAIRSQGRTWLIRDLIEKPKPEIAPSNLAVIGRYILPPEVLQILQDTEPGQGGEIQLTDALRNVARKSLLGYEFSGKRYDLGNPMGFLKANIVFGMKRPELKEAIRNLLKS
jgi:UTP--glucose-1-phosphate uridylyltransferase